MQKTMKFRTAESMKFLIILIVVLLPQIFAVSDSAGQESARIYAAVLETKAFVVGRANDPSGLQVYRSDTTWTHYGWKNTRNFGVAASPKNKDLIYLACGNGVIRSLDKGQSWRITSGWEITEVLDLAIHPDFPETVFIATAYGAWKSDNSGDTWKEINDGLKRKFLESMESDIADKSRFIAAGEEGLFEWTGKTGTWKNIYSGSSPVLDVQQCKSSPEIWTAGVEDCGLIISHDNGMSWKPAEGEISTKTIYASAVNSSNTAVIAAGGYGTGVFFSKDAGKTWTHSNNGQFGNGVHALVFDPVRQNRVWAGTIYGGVLYSDDFGSTWVYTGLNGSLIWDLIIIGDK